MSRVETHENGVNILLWLVESGYKIKTRLLVRGAFSPSGSSVSLRPSFYSLVCLFSILHRPLAGSLNLAELARHIRRPGAAYAMAVPAPHILSQHATNCMDSKCPGPSVPSLHSGCSSGLGDHCAVLHFPYG
uniref:Uncharacterized protein n=1 Tax=Pipistrellus kuhlii TaxID=59472 RepID=A0A7J7TA89_PIPKU|nr:hypothetical protein mPipKuh1_009689 [Pipistrellus kuhlii]